VLHVLLDHGVLELLADQTLSVLHGVGGVLGHLVLGCVADQTFILGEGDLAGGGLVALVVGDDFYVVVAEDRNAGIGCS